MKKTHEFVPRGRGKSSTPSLMGKLTTGGTEPPAPVSSWALHLSLLGRLIFGRYFTCKA